MAVPVSALADTIIRTRADLDEHGLTGSILGHVGDGNFHVTLLIDRDDPADVARGMEFHDRVVRGALEAGGTCTGEHGVGYGKADLSRARARGRRRAPHARDQARARPRRHLQPRQGRRRRGARGRLGPGVTIASCSAPSTTAADGRPTRPSIAASTSSPTGSCAPTRSSARSAARGLMNVDQLRRGIESMPPEDYERASYYERWLFSIETRLAEEGVVAPGELDARLAP